MCLTGRLDPFCEIIPLRAERRREQHGNTVETDSETDDRPPVDPQLSAAIARSITDSEDETTSVTREPSLGYNSDLENLEGKPVYIKDFGTTTTFDNM